MNAEETNELLMVSSSPHTHANESVPRIMWDVVIALMPALLVSIWFFRLNALRLIGICVTSCLVTEYLCRKLMRRENSLGDWSAVVTGLLLAFNLPPALPGWMAVVGSVFAIAVAKQIFGGLGYNVFNPALAGRAFMLISFTGAMTTWSKSAWVMHTAGLDTDAMTQATVDALATATPLGFAKTAIKLHQGLPDFNTWGVFRDFFLGNMNGCIGEVSAAALLLGAIYLLYRRVISWHTPIAYLATVFIYAAILHYFQPLDSLPAWVHVFSGGLILGAFFMATDMVTTPVTHLGMIIFGVGCGILTMVIRTVLSGAYPEGVSFSILIMNSLTPLINRATRHRIFGTVKK